MHAQLLLALSLISTACSSSASMGGDSRVAPPTSKSQTGKETSYGSPNAEGAPAVGNAPAEPVISNESILNSSTVSEEADRPKAVTGAYLHCVKTAEMQTLLEVGCRFDDDAGNRVDQAVLAQSIRYDVVKPAISGLTVSVLELKSSYRLYDLVLTYESSTLAKSLSALPKTQIKATLTEPKVTMDPAALNKTVSEIIVTPKVRESNFVVYKAENETVVLDRIAGNYFVRITGSKRSWSQAKTDCRNLTISGLSWGLTAWGPLELLFQHGVRDDASAVEALGLNANTVVWDQHELPDDPSWAYTLILWDGSATQVGWNYAPKTDVLARPLCLY